MTPLINKMVKLVPDPETFMWFDMGTLGANETAPIAAMCDTPLPFEICALVGVDEGQEFVICLRQIGQAVGVIARTLTATGFRKHPEFTYLGQPDGLRTVDLDGKAITPFSSIEGIVGTISGWLWKLSPMQRAHKPTARPSLINSKRAAKGKGPVLFDWHTVTVKPTPTKGESQGGTHASPRLHDRRGHWRKYPSGKTGWVKNCKVGDASRGVVFKDYKVNEKEGT